MLICTDPTECDRCEGTEFTFHTNPRRPDNDCYVCTYCDAHFYIYEVGHHDPEPDSE